MSKERWLDFAEILDALRIIPRFILLGGWTSAMLYIYYTTVWFMGLSDASMWDMGFISSTISALFLAVQQLTARYFDGGRDWK